MSEIHTLLPIIHALFYSFFTSDYSNCNFWETDPHLKPKMFPALATSLFTGAVILYGEKMWNLKMTDKWLMTCAKLYLEINEFSWIFTWYSVENHTQWCFNRFMKQNGWPKTVPPSRNPCLQSIIPLFSSYLKSTGFWGKSPLLFIVLGTFTEPHKSYEVWGYLRTYIVMDRCSRL